MERDIEHLRLLSIFHYVVSGMVGLFSCFPIIHLVIGIAILVGGNGIFPVKSPAGGPAEAKLVGLLFTVFAAVIILFGWTIAVLVALAGRNLARRTRYTYCMVVAGLVCLFVPLGTVLGVFTIFVLGRSSVKELFDSHDLAESAER